MVYYGYTFNYGNSLSSSNANINGTCYFFTNDSYCDGTCKDSISIVSSAGGSVGYSAGTTAYCTEKQDYWKFIEDTTLGEYNISNINNVCVYGNPNNNWDTCLPSDEAKISKVYVTSQQTSSMGTSLVNAGSGLVHIGIQLMPYAIGFVIVLVLFGLIKNWGKLKTNRQLKRLHRQKTRSERREIERYRKK